jgi:thymidine kinase
MIPMQNSSGYHYINPDLRDSVKDVFTTILEEFISQGKFADKELQHEKPVDRDTLIDLFLHPDLTQYRLKLDNLLRGSLFICGKSGSGKTMTMARLLECYGMEHVPFACFDLEGGFTELKNLGKVLKREDIDIQVYDCSKKEFDDKEYIINLAKDAFFKGKQSVFDLSNVENFEKSLKICFLYVWAIWAIVRRMNHKMVHVVVIDECQHFIPEQGFMTMKNVSQKIRKMSILLELKMNQISTQGRKRGIHSILSSQRPQQVRKSVITQAKAFILHSPSSWDSDVYSDIIGSVASQRKIDMLTMMRNFNSGQAFYIGGNGERLRVTIKPRITRHTGKTPDLQSTLKRARKNRESEIESALSDEDMAELNDVIPDGKDEDDEDIGGKEVGAGSDAIGGRVGGKSQVSEFRRGRGRPKKGRGGF